MKKRIISLLTATILLLLLPLSFSGADNGTYNDAYGSTYWDSTNGAYMYNQPHYGIVICRQLSVRNRPSTSGSSYETLTNGKPVKILGYVPQSYNGEEYYVVERAAGGFISNTGNTSYGYVKASLVKMDPEFIFADRLLNLYTTPWGDGQKNGEQRNRYFLVLSQYSNWYAVQTMESNPGTSFIRSSDIYSSYYSKKVVVVWDTDLYDEESMYKIQSVSRFTSGRQVDVSGGYTLVVFNEGAPNEFRAWINTMYIARVIN